MLCLSALAFVDVYVVSGDVCAFIHAVFEGIMLFLAGKHLWSIWSDGLLLPVWLVRLFFFDVLLWPNLPITIYPYYVRFVDSTFPGKSPADMSIPPLRIKIMLESNPLKSRILVRRLAVVPRHVSPQNLVGDALWFSVMAVMCRVLSSESDLAIWPRARNGSAHAS